MSLETKNKIPFVTLKITIEAPNYKILQSKKYIISCFCNIFNLEYIYLSLPSKNKKLALLRSPHIHKKTWRTYIEKTVRCKYTINFKDNLKFQKGITKFNSLLNNLSTNCKIKLHYYS